VARYLVERIFPQGFTMPMTDAGVAQCAGLIDRNADLGVTWVHSYVSDDRRKTFCVYDGPDPESIRRASARNGLPIESITRVRVLDPYFFL